MHFHPVFYFITGWPSMETFRQMVRNYVAHGVRAIQVDMPSADPYGESAFIQAGMKRARELYGPDFGIYMKNLREVRAEFPDLEMHLVVYPDVVESIGLERFASFCREMNFFTVLASRTDELQKAGVCTTEFVHYQMPEPAVEHALHTQNLMMLRSNSRYETLPPRDGMRTWKQRIDWLRSRGFRGPIYAVAGISTPEQLQEIKAAGADGAYIGSVLMKKWTQEDALWKILDEFKALTE